MFIIMRILVKQPNTPVEHRIWSGPLYRSSVSHRLEQS